MLNHEAWRLLAEVHAQPRLDALAPEHLGALVCAFSRSRYHPAHLLAAAADRLAAAAPELRASTLARTMQAYASLRHYHPRLLRALAREACRRLRPGRQPGSGEGGSGAGLFSSLSLRGLLLAGPPGDPGGHRAPPFLLDDLARLADACAELGAASAAGATDVDFGPLLQVLLLLLPRIGSGGDGALGRAGGGRG